MITYRELLSRLNKMEQHELDTLARVEDYDHAAERNKVIYVEGYGVNENGDLTLQSEEFVVENDDEPEDEGQPTEYEEWQDYMGGDDWDHGQFDE